MRTLEMLIHRYGLERVVARFGRAVLVRRDDARYELRGGCPRDADDAREWAAHFLHEALLPVPPARRRPACLREVTPSIR